MHTQHMVPVCSCEQPQNMQPRTLTPGTQPTHQQRPRNLSNLNARSALLHMPDNIPPILRPLQRAMPQHPQSPCHVKRTCLAYRKFLSETFSASADNNGGRCWCSYCQMTSEAAVSPTNSRATRCRSTPERCCPRASETCISADPPRVHLLRVGAGARKGLALVAEPPVDEPMLAPKVHVPKDTSCCPAGTKISTPRA